MNPEPTVAGTGIVISDYCVCLHMCIQRCLSSELAGKKIIFQPQKHPCTSVRVDNFSLLNNTPGVMYSLSPQRSQGLKISWLTIIVVKKESERKNVPGIKNEEGDKVTSLVISIYLPATIFKMSLEHALCVCACAIKLVYATVLKTYRWTDVCCFLIYVCLCVRVWVCVCVCPLLLWFLYCFIIEKWFVLLRGYITKATLK